MSRVSIASIAEKASISPTTVSLVLNNHPLSQRVAKSTAERIRKIAAEMNYRPHYAARALSQRRTNVLGFICGGINTPYFSELANALLLAAERHGYKLMVMATQWDYRKELDALDLMLDRSVDGIIMYSNCLSEGSRELSMIREQKIPLVVVGHSIAGVNCIGTDFGPGIDLAFRRMQDSGCRRIGFAYEPELTDKLLLYRECCRRYGCEPFEFFSENVAARGGAYVVQRGRDFAALESRPDGLIVSSDYLAAMLLRGMRDAGMVIPRDLSVVGIDNIPGCDFMEPPLSSISQDFTRLADMAVLRVVAMLRQDGLEPEIALISSTLVERRSIRDRKTATT